MLRALRTDAPGRGDAIVSCCRCGCGLLRFHAFGNPLTPPLHHRPQHLCNRAVLVWQHPRPEPTYRYAGMRSFLCIAMANGFYEPHPFREGVSALILSRKSIFIFLFYAGFTLLPPLLMVRRVFLDRRIRFPVVCVLVLACGMVIEIYLLPHYVALFTGAFYAIGLQAMRHLRLWRPEGRPMGLALVRLHVFLCVCIGGFAAFCGATSFRAARIPTK